MLEAASGGLLSRDLKAGWTTADLLGSCPLRFWVSQRMGAPQPVWAMCSRAHHPHSKKAFSYISVKFPVFHIVPSLLSNRWEGSGSVFFTPSHQVYTWIRSHLNFLFSCLVSLSSLSLFSYKKWSHYLVVLMAFSRTCSHMSLSFLYWKGQNWTQHLNHHLTSGSCQSTSVSTYLVHFSPVCLLGCCGTCCRNC